MKRLRIRTLVPFLAVLAIPHSGIRAQDAPGPGPEAAAMDIISHVPGAPSKEELEGQMKPLSEAERERLFAKICLQVAKINPVLAFKMASDYPIRLQGFQEDLMQYWAHDDLPAALTWLSSYPLGPQRDRFIGRLCLVLAETQPKDAIIIAREQIMDERYRDMVTAAAENQTN